MSKQGMSFADFLIIVAIVLLLAALAVPRFVKAPDYGDEQDDVALESTNTVSSAEATNSPTAP